MLNIPSTLYHDIYLTKIYHHVHHTVTSTDGNFHKSLDEQISEDLILDSYSSISYMGRAKFYGRQVVQLLISFAHMDFFANNKDA